MTAPLNIALPHDTPVFKEFLDFADRVLVHKPAMTPDEIRAAAAVARRYSDAHATPKPDIASVRGRAVRRIADWLRDEYAKAPFRVSMTPRESCIHTFQVSVFRDKGPGKRPETRCMTTGSSDRDEARARIVEAVAMVKAEGIPLIASSHAGRPRAATQTPETVAALVFKWLGGQGGIVLRRDPTYRYGRKDNPMLGASSSACPIRYFTMPRGSSKADCIAFVEEVARHLAGKGETVTIERKGAR